MISLGGTNHLGDAIWDDSVPKYVVVLPRTLTSTEDRGYWGGENPALGPFFVSGSGSHKPQCQLTHALALDHSSLANKKGVT